jgi:hypothetical protein
MRILNPYYLLLLVTGIFTGAISTDAASRSELLSQLDFNEDGELTQFEIKAGLQYRLDPAWEKKIFAFQKAGKATEDDFADADETLEGRYLEFQRDFGARRAYPLKAKYPNERGEMVLIPAERLGMTKMLGELAPDTTSRWVVKEKDPWKRFRVRRSADQLLLPSDNADGALFSYSADFKNNTDQWTVHAAVGWDLAFELNDELADASDPKNPRAAVRQFGEIGLKSFFFRPSVAFDKVTTGGSDTDEEDSLVFRFGAGAKYRVPGATVDSVFAGIDGEMNARYDTNSEGEVGIFGGEINLVPYMGDAHFLNTGFNSFGPFKAAWSVALHAEWSTVANDGGDPELVARPDIFRAGGVAGVRLVPKKLTDLAIGGSYKYYPAWTDDSYGLELLNAFVEWKVFGGEHLSVKINYDRGRTMDREQRDNRLTVGVGVLY